MRFGTVFIGRQISGLVRNDVAHLLIAAAAISEISIPQVFDSSRK